MAVPGEPQPHQPGVTPVLGSQLEHLWEGGGQCVRVRMGQVWDAEEENFGIAQDLL